MDYSIPFVVLMGMGTVFFGLICLIAITALMGKILHREAPAAPAAQTAPAAQAAPALDAPTVAAIAAALAEELGTDVTGLRIHSIRRLN